MIIQRPDRKLITDGGKVYDEKYSEKRKVIATACAVCAMFSMTTTAMAAEVDASKAEPQITKTITKTDDGAVVTEVLHHTHLHMVRCISIRQKEELANMILRRT